MARYGTARADEIEAAGGLIATSFGIPTGDEQPWLAVAGHENLRVLRDGDTPVAALIHIPMGQFFGGRSVPMVGIAAVACPPEHRGDGAATELMKRTVRELHRRGVALSGLYPAVQSLYRRAGYEVAAARHETAVLARDLGDRERTLPVRPYAPADVRAVEALYAKNAAARPGWLDRGPYVWGRVRAHRTERVHGYVVEEDGAVAGHVFFRQYHRPDHPLFMDCVVHGLEARSARARRRLLTLLGDLRSLNDEVRLFGAMFDERTHGIEERRYRVRVANPYMLRVTHVPAALEARGWSTAVRGDLHLEVVDDVVRGNAKRWRLRVEGGRAEVREGGRGRLRIDVRALAALYTGFASPFTLAARGGLEASRPTLELAEALFAGPAPTLEDMF